MEEGQCEACGIVIGGSEEHYRFEYREHMICSWCQAQWRSREKRVGREISWEEFISGKLVGESLYKKPMRAKKRKGGE